MRLPTDLQILNHIYSQYYGTFKDFSTESPKRSTKVFVPINISSIANYFRVDLDIVFGRLYYHLNQKYSYVDSDGTNIHFFKLAVGSDKHCINFPLLSSVLAGLRQEETKNRWAIGIAVVSVIISIISIVISITNP